MRAAVLKYFLFLFVGFQLFTKICLAQNYSIPVQIKWSGIEKKQFSESFAVSFLNCEGADYVFHKHNLPLVTAKINLPQKYNSAKARMLKAEFFPLNEIEFKVIEKHLSLIKEAIDLDVSLINDQKTIVASVGFLPIRKNSLTGKYEKLISCDIELFDLNEAGNKSIKSIHTYAANSVLRSGNWFRLGVWEDAMYKIDYNMLKLMGLDVDNLDPRNIRIYGNGTGALNENNSAERVDDLAENSVFVFGEQDGKFNKEDYVCFFGKSPHSWSHSTDQHFHHNHNIYTDTAYYFLTVDLGAGKRISTENSSSLIANNSSSSYDYLYYYENDLENLVKSGREWYGEKYDTQLSRTFNLSIPNYISNTPVYFKVDVAARSTPASNFVFTCQGASINLQPYAIGLEYWMDPAGVATGETVFNSSSSDFTVNSTFTKNPNFSTATGWLNFFEINCRASIDASLQNFMFRDNQSVGVNKITQFFISNFNASNQYVLDVTNPVNAKNIIVNNSSFIVNTDYLRSFYLFANDKASLKRPLYVDKIENQNLHALGFADMVIITHPLFYNEAQRLAQLHKMYDNYSVHVVTVQQVYNEFSSGAQDITAIKHFMKMFYDRAGTSGTYPKHLLLFGDASYNYKSKASTNTNFIPSYQAENSVSYIDSYVSDDYFGLLDDSESSSMAEGVDIAIGRLPVKNVTEAKTVVDKYYSYVERKTIDVNSSSQITRQSLASGDWKNVVCFVADDQDGGLHLRDADKLAVYVDTNFKEMNVDKIYFDSYKQESSSGGQRYPDVKSAINNRVEKGALILNYTGHGGETGWAHERVLEIVDINSWHNEEKLPLFVTATCEFSRFDDPTRTSAGEDVLLKTNGGGIGLLTTTRLVFSSPNFVLNQNFYKTVFQKENNEIITIGEACRKTKNLSANPFSSNHRNFSMLGDPAIKLHYPKNKIVTTAINGITVQAITDTLKALSRVTIKGFVGDENGSKLSNFNGIIYPTVYDKMAELSTISNDLDSPPIKYKLQKNAVYRGKVTVTNGEFMFTFVVPKDISYNFGKGRISYFAESTEADAKGYNENFIIGGINTNAPVDEIGPEVKLYMNDDKFVAGSITNEEPVLLAYVTDENGINTVGAGIGHDIVGVLDNNTEKSIVLNDFYQSDLNTYQSGKVLYPFSKLTEGSHTLDFKIWDVYNNSSKSSIDFIVAKSADLALNHVLNYPNPFTTRTKFLFEHNQPYTDLNVLVQIFTVSGKLIKTIDQTIFTNGFRSEELEWDGKDDFGDKIGRGVYIYKLKVTSADGKTAEQYEKLVLLN